MAFILRLRLAVGFLTRIPVGNVRASDEDFARSLGYFALVGGLIGLLLSGIAFLLAPHLPSYVVAGALVAFSAAITGALHLDGLADVFDGLGGGRGDAARMLEIMRDSRIGSHGAVALIVYLLLKVAVLAPVIEASAFTWVALTPLVARALLVPAIAVVPYARKEGLGSSFQAHVGPWELLAASLAIGLALVLGGPTAALACVCAAATMTIFTGLIVSKIGGLTGDGYGALIEIAELSFLTALIWQ